MTQSEWPRHLTAQIARQLVRLRGRMSAQQLADATAELGHPIPRSVIANLESGRRDTVSVAEVLVLARALQVPPLELVLPLGREQTVEVLPGTVVDTWEAAKWFTGEQPFPSSDDDVEEWAPGQFREQDRLLVTWDRTRRSLAEAKAKAGGADRHTPTDRPDILEQHLGAIEYLEDAVHAVEKQIRLYRAIARRHGVDLGELPPELAHIDGDDDGQR